MRERERKSRKKKFRGAFPLEDRKQETFKELSSRWVFSWAFDKVKPTS